MMKILNPLRTFAAGLLLVFLTGCGNPAAKYGVSGTVSYDGKPLPEGSIGFEPVPDSSAPENRMSTGSQIVDGKYATPSGRGLGGGKYIVRIRPPMLGSGTEITAKSNNFPVFETTIDFPKETTVKDFDIPAGRTLIR